MTTQQLVRRTEGIPSSVANEMCHSLVTHAQNINNAIRETVDDASELRIQLEEANMAIMSLKVQETASKYDLSQAHKQIKEKLSKIEDAEDRLAKYHADAEEDRNDLRESLSRFASAKDEKERSKLCGLLLEVSRFS